MKCLKDGKQSINSDKRLQKLDFIDKELQLKHDI